MGLSVEHAIDDREETSGTPRSAKELAHLTAWIATGGMDTN